MRHVIPIVMLLWLVAGPAVQAHEGHEHMDQAKTGLIDPSLLGFTGLKDVFNIHPAFVHFPIAFFPGALMLYGLGILLKRPSWTVAGRACLYLGAASTVITIVTGWQAQSSFPHNERIHHMMMTHLHIGATIGVLAAVLVLWSFWHRAQQPRGRYAFLAILAFTSYAVLQNGDLGSRMVYVEGAAVKPAVGIITGERRHGDGTTEHAGHAHDEGSAGERGHEHAH